MGVLSSRQDVQDREMLYVNVNYDNDPPTMEIRRDGKTVMFEPLGGNINSSSQPIEAGALLALLVRLGYDLDYTEFP